MISDHFDDDQNVIAMRETARTIGLTALLVKASQSPDISTTKDLVRKALVLLGERS